MNPKFKSFLLNLTNSTNCKELELIQSLWSGYGNIMRYKLDNSAYNTLIVKHISENKAENHPRGWNTNIGHQRKMKSYQVEMNWYHDWNHLCSNGSKTPNFIGSFSHNKEHWIVLEDLDVKYPLRKQEVSLEELKNCLQWLAQFHGKFMGAAPKGLWQIGSYWHLDTRPEELHKISNPKIKAKAANIDEVLNKATYQTIIHGDAKLANFCFSEDSKSIAAVDFQYVGGGCGMKDLAYFLGSSLSSSDLETHQDELLDFYFSQLKAALKSHSKDTINPQELESEWRELYPFASADFTRFLLGWMPTHQKINKYQLNLLNLVLSKI